MINFFVQASLKFRFVVVAAVLVLMVAGFMRMVDTPVDLLPEFSPVVVVEVQTEALGLSAAEVEQLITVPLEADLLNGVAWVDSIQSESLPSVSSIRMIFESGTDEMAARQMVQEKLTQAAGLPNVSKAPIMLQPVSSISRVYMIGLHSEKISLIDISVLARWNIRPHLMAVEGVAHVSIWGQRKRQLQVLVDPEQLRHADISLHDVVSTTGNALWYSPLSFLTASSPGTGGFIDTPNQRLGIRHVLPIVSNEGLSRIIVDGSDKRLGDIAEVVEDHQPLIGDAIVGKDSGVMLVVEKFSWANTLDVTKGVEKALDDLRPGLKDINIDTQIYRPASFIERVVRNFSTTLLISGVLIAVGLLLCFIDWRPSLVATVFVVTTVLVAWLVLFLQGVIINGLIISGFIMAFGVIVHDVIADTQDYRQKRVLADQSLGRKDVWELISGFTLRMRGTLSFATLAVLLTVVPFFFFDGVQNAFFSAIGKGYVLVVIASTLVALTLTPALSLLVMPKGGSKVSLSPLSKLFSRAAQGLYQRFSEFSLVAYIITGVALLAVLAALIFAPSKAIFPEFQETDLLVNLKAKPGISQPKMSKIINKVTEGLRATSGVIGAGSQIGRAVTSDRVVGMNTTEIWLTVDPDADRDAVVKEVERLVSANPEIEFSIASYSAERISALAEKESQNDSLTVRIYGQDMVILLQEAEKLKNSLSGMSGIVNMETLKADIEPGIEVQVDLERAKEYSIKPGDIRRAAATLISGLHVGNLFEDKKYLMWWSGVNPRFVPVLKIFVIFCLKPLMVDMFVLMKLLMYVWFLAPGQSSVKVLPGMPIFR